LGEFDQAFDLLEKMLPGASDWMKVWIRYDSDLDPLRSLPRDQKVLELIQ
jgi:adenylate cyclase